MADGTRTRRPRRKPVDPATAARADRIIEEVRAWYRRGQQALGLEGAQDVGQAMQTLSAEVGTTPATMRRARQFARVYTEKHLEALLKLRTPKGLPLGWSHVQELISVKAPAERARLRKLAAKDGWTVCKVSQIPDLRHGQLEQLPANTRARFLRSRAIEKPREALNAIWKG